MHVDVVFQLEYEGLVTVALGAVVQDLQAALSFNRVLVYIRPEFGVEFHNYEGHNLLMRAALIRGFNLTFISSGPQIFASYLIPLFNPSGVQVTLLASEFHTAFEARYIVEVDILEKSLLQVDFYIIRGHIDWNSRVLGPQDVVPLPLLIVVIVMDFKFLAIDDLHVRLHPFLVLMIKWSPIFFGFDGLLIKH